MKYSVSAEALGSAFVVPTAVADKHLKLATPLQIKTLLYVFRNLSEGINPQKTADFLNADVNDICDALDYWVGAGVLVGETNAEKEKTEKNISAPTAELPTYEDVMRRALEDKKVSLLLNEAQLYFGGALSRNVSRFLLSLYDDCGMDTSVILFLLSYASKKEKCNLTFIRNVSNAWLKAGVETVVDAENEIKKSVVSDLAWQVVRKAFGLENRKPSAKEKEFSNLWVNEWKTSPELLNAAYDACVDSKSKFSLPYTAKIIEAWHKDNIKSPEDLKKEKPAENRKQSKYSYGGFDIDKFDEMLNKD